MEFKHSTPLPNGWTILSLESVCKKITSGGTPSRKHPEFYEGGTIPWVKTKELNDSWIYDTEEQITDKGLNSSSAKLLPRNTILLAMYGATVAQLGILSHEMTCNQASCALIADEEKAHFRFLFYLLLAHRKMIKSLSVGAAQQNLSAKQVKQFSFRFPPIEEQRAIAHILGTLDDKIELNRQMNRTLEAMAQTLFKSWFIDFDPVVLNALRAGNPIPEKFAQRAVHYRDNPNALGLPEETLRQFPDHFQDSELGPIPEGWRVGIVSDLATIASGKRPKKRSKEKNVEFRIPLYGGGGIMAYVEEPLVTEPLLLTGRVGTLGKIFRISEPCWPSDNTLILFPKKKIYFHFVFFMLQLIEFESLNRGSTQPLVTQMDLSNQSLVIPNANVSNLFWVNVYSLFEKIDKSLEESSILSSLRDTLLPKLISGELRVPDAEKLLEEAL